jgi:hypothetical protein
MLRRKYIRASGSLNLDHDLRLCHFAYDAIESVPCRICSRSAIKDQSLWRLDEECRDSGMLENSDREGIVNLKLWLLRRVSVWRFFRDLLRKKVAPQRVAGHTTGSLSMV